MKTKFYILLTMLLTCVMQVKGEVTVGATEDVTVVQGNRNSTMNALCPAYKYAASQILYTADEIGRRGLITQISFRVQTPATSVINGTVNVYLGESDQMTLTSSNQMEKNAMTPVFSSTNYTFAQVSGWETITLDTPFEYRGNGNLIVAVESSKESVFSNFSYFCNKETVNTKVVRRYSSTNTNMSNAFGAGSVENTEYRPDLKLSFASQITSTTATGTSSSYLYGFGPYDKYFSSQTMYTPAEIGLDGECGFITEIAYYVGTGAPADNTITEWVAIYMGESDKTSMSTANMLTASDLSIVGIDIVKSLPTETGWRTIKLVYPYYYSGKKNLVVGVAADRDKYCTTMQYRYHTTTSNMSVTQMTDTDADKEKYTTVYNNAGMTATKNVPDTRFTIKKVANKCLQIVGTGTAGNNGIALCPYSTNGASQTLYTKEDVGGAGKITKLAYRVMPYDSNSSLTPVSMNVEIYMGEWTDATLTTGHYMTKEMMTNVFSGTVTTGNNGSGWEDITLTTPYNYSAKKNLVVAISTTKSSTTTANYYYYTSTTDKAITSGSTSDPFEIGKMTNNNRSANIRFTFEHDCVNYTQGGFGICDRCGMNVSDVFEAPKTIGGTSYYALKNVGNLKWLSQQQNKGSLSSAYRYYYLQNDIDLTGYDWTPIGTDSKPANYIYFYGLNYETNAGHTISGLPSGSYLFGTMSGAAIRSVRLANGSLVQTFKGGTISQSLTIQSGAKIYGTKTGGTVLSSFYLSNSETTDGGRTLAQMKSGQVTYELNAYNSAGKKTTWYQTIGTDNYPLTDNTRSRVYRYTACGGNYVYTNDAAKSGTAVPHTLTNNTLCSACGGQPTTLSEDVVLDRTKAYARTVQAQMASGKKLTYKRTYGSSDVNKWQSFYVPFAMKYTEAYSKQFDIAEILDFGVFEDTNKDGALNSQDEKKLSVSYLNVGSITKPNTAYLIRPKSNSTITFESYDGKVYPNTLNSIELSTMKDQIEITPTYTPVTTSGAKKQLVGGALSSSTSTLYSFSWYATPSYKNGKTWDQSTINIYAHRFGVTELVDNDNTSNDFVSYTQASDEVVDNLLYERTFVERQAHNWQSMYLPFDVVVEESGDDVYPKYAKFVSITTESGVDYINIQKCVAGDVIPANTPALVCVDEPQVLTYSYPRATIKAASSATNKVFNSGLATYTMIGRYAPYQNTSEWYAISKKDGDFHPMTSTAKLPPYRFYMTIQKKTAGAGELRVVIRDVDEMETAIDSIVDDSEESDAIYTLDGRKVQEDSLQPGIYVKNGKKISVKK